MIDEHLLKGNSVLYPGICANESTAPAGLPGTPILTTVAPMLTRHNGPIIVVSEPSQPVDAISAIVFPG